MAGNFLHRDDRVRRARLRVHARGRRQGPEGWIDSTRTGSFSRETRRGPLPPRVQRRAWPQVAYRTPSIRSRPRKPGKPPATPASPGTANSLPWRAAPTKSISLILKAPCRRPTFTSTERAWACTTTAGIPDFPSISPANRFRHLRDARGKT